jgi:iron complex transport system substrate-binding protein
VKPAGWRARRAWAALFAGATLIPACDRQARPPQPGGDSAASPRAATTDSPILRDYVIEPLLDENEAGQPCPRLVSAAPNITEICCALGVAEHLVGRTRYCEFIEPARRVASIGDLVSLNIETLLQLRPERVLVSGTSRGIADRLERAGLAFESLPDISLDDLFRTITHLGKLTNRPRTAALLVKALTTDLEYVATTSQGSPSRRVLIVLEPLTLPPTAPFVAGPGSFYDDLLRRAGHRNVASVARDAYAAVSLEFVLSADPEVIVELVPQPNQRPAGDADARRAWSQVGPLTAVANGRVRIVVGPDASILGPRIARFYADLLRAIETPAGE